jgi:hypothetical protein
VSAAVGEPVEASYNFLSLYAAQGVCPLHMDAPQAKWTLDLCVDQAVRWPLHVSRVIPWPEDTPEAWTRPEWIEETKRSPELRFQGFDMEPGEAVVFSGSSQWHYRDPMPNGGGAQGCTLLFLHFIPRGTAELAEPANWARLFAVPQLAELAGLSPSPAKTLI